MLTDEELKKLSDEVDQKHDLLIKEMNERTKAKEDSIKASKIPQQTKDVSEQLEQKVEPNGLPKEKGTEGKQKDFGLSDSFLNYIKGTKPNPKINFTTRMNPSSLEFSVGNYAMIKKNDKPYRIVPFIYQFDPETHNIWSIFIAKSFFGIRQSFFDKFQTTLLRIPFNKSQAQNIGQGYYAEFDEVTEAQLNIIPHDTQQNLDARIDAQTYISQNLLLHKHLTSFSKSQINWTLIAIGVAFLLLGIFLIYYFLKNPHALSNVLHLG